MIRGFKQIAIYVLVLAAAGAGVWYLSQRPPQRPETKVFLGTAAAYRNGALIVTGFPDSKEGVKKGSGVEVKVTLGPETKIIKESGAYKLRVSPGAAKPPSPDDITRDRQEVSLKELREDMVSKAVSVKIVAGQNIYGIDKFTAAEIYYNTDGLFYNH